ncbi:MAG: hypothetical protein SFV54_12585 [Bryobacteraceae bacterium]|nr:hypothetical protein [Bryobacteraceae bacterium]
MRLPLAILALAAVLSGAANNKLERASVRVPVWTEEGKPLPAGIEAKVEGAAAPVKRVRGPGDELIVLIVLDVVGDIALVDPAREALIESITALPPNVWVGLLRAQDGLRVLLDPTGDRKVVSDAIRGLPISGRPGLLETVDQAARLADLVARKSAVRLALLYVTDSNIYGYREDYTNPVVNSSDSRDLSRRFPEGLVREKISRLEDSLVTLEVPLFIAHLNWQRDRLNEAYQTGLLQLAQVTGGTALFCRTLAEVPEAVRRTMDRITQHSTLELQLPDKPLKSLQVVIEAGDLPLSYRTRFVLKEK